MLFAGDVLVFATALAIAAFSPGPANMTLIAIVITNGVRQDICFSIGIILGDLVWLTLSLGGLAVIAAKIPLVFIIIKWLGISYLIYMAIILWKSTILVDQNTAKPVTKCVFRQFISGFILTMGNPKMMLFYIALLASLLNPDNVTFLGYLSLMAAVIVVLIIVFTIFIITSAKARSMLKNDNHLRKLDHLTAVTLVGAATWIAVK